MVADASGKERVQSPAPLIQTTFLPISYVPSFPCSTDWAKYIGMDLALVQPPLPEGKGQELVGTRQWCKIAAVESSKKTSLGWFDLRQSRHDTSEQQPLLGEDRGDGSERQQSDNFWPRLGRWRIGMKMEDAVIEFPEGEHWNEPK